MQLKFIKLILWIGLLVFGSHQSALADAPVWKVMKGVHHVYIGGTIHVLSKSDYPLPAPFETAYNQSAKLILETDTRKMQTPEFQAALMRKVVYSDGRNLKMVLTASTFQKLEKHLASRGIPIRNFMKLKPGMVALTITIIELQRLGLMGTGVDEFFSLRALNDQKMVGQLETVDDQLELISGLGDGQENEIINHTLQETKKLPDLMQTMKTAWRQGDNTALENIILRPFKKDFPGVYNRVVVNRNNAWLPKIEIMLQTKEVEFILVGALHLIGEDGVLAKLKKRGYTIQKP
jgi:uncharacterized protein YbaP (TraB family)